MAILSEATEMKESYSIIYKATNRINGKGYVGQTTRTLTARKAEHKHRVNLQSDYFFKNAIKKYGFDAFDWQVLAYANSKECLDSLEIEYIKLHATFGKQGYNMNEGGNGVSDATKEKMRNSVLGKKVSDITKKKMSQSHYERYKNPEAVEKLRQSLLLRWSNDSINRERFRKMMSGENNPQFGKKGSLSGAAKEYIITTPVNAEIKIVSLTEFCEKWDRDKLNPKNLSMCARGKRNHHHGYKCRYSISEERATTIPSGSTSKWMEAVGILKRDKDIVLSA